MRIRVDALEARRVADEVGPGQGGARGSTTGRSTSCSACRRSPPSAPGCSACSTTPRSSSRPPSATSWSAWLGALTRARSRTAAGRRPRGRRSRRRRRPRPRPRSAPGRETSRRLRRLLALVGWLAQVGEAPIAEAARRFGMSEKELVAELELAACCGTPPYTPDTLMEIEVSEHSVRAFLPAEYARPRRLTPAEGFAVAASARLLLAVPGSEDDALRRALAKLDAALGSREAVGLDVDAPAHLAAVREAADAGPGARDRLPLGLARRAHHAHGGAGAGGHHRRPLVSRRLLPPGRGHAALPGRPDRRGARRSSSPAVPAPARARPLEEMFVPGPGRGRGPSAARARTRSGCPSRCRCGRSARDDDGTVTDVVLDVSGMAWFERLLLQLGPAARVVSPPELTGAGGRRGPPGAGALRLPEPGRLLVEPDRRRPSRAGPPPIARAPDRSAGSGRV